jgi:aminoglycoside phosphotransferase (APT) family kinase protein
VRRIVEEHCGSDVVEAASQGAGFTPGFASVLTCADGSRHFVKAASVRAQRAIAEAYRAEARGLRALPAAAPAPRLTWAHDPADGGEEWVVLGIEHVAARQPARPWTDGDLDACAAMLQQLATDLSPAPEELELAAATEDFAPWPALWDRLRGGLPQVTGLAAYHQEAARLAAAFRDVVAGPAVVHGDVRDDNLLLAGDGRVLLCDWNFPFAGADWLDSFFLLIGPRGDGLDVEAAIAASPLLAAADPQHVDVVLALATGYFLRMSAQPVPATSPFLREVQRWQGEVCWDWLAERRGWR